MGNVFVACLVAALLAGAADAAGLSHTAQAGAGGPVPAGTTATSVSFVSASEAFVLGTAPCAHNPCSVILRTEDRGLSWVGLPAPLERVSAPFGNGLWGLRFADPSRGYAFGRGIWRTSDGGQTWTPMSVPGRFVVAFAAVHDQELVALTSTCRKCGKKLTLYHRPISGRRWRRVARSGPHAFAFAFAVHGNDVWVLAGERLFVSADAGRTFAAHVQPCPRKGASLPIASSIADDGSHTYLLCTGQGFASHTIKYIYRTRGTVSGWRVVGKAPTPGDAGDLAAGSDRAIVIASTSAASWLYRSHSSGRRWHTVLTIDDGGIGWGDLGFTTASDGVVIHGPATHDGGSASHPGQVLLTEDGGKSWHSVSF